MSAHDINPLNLEKWMAYLGRKRHLGRCERGHWDCSPVWNGTCSYEVRQMLAERTTQQVTQGETMDKKLFVGMAQDHAKVIGAHRELVLKLSEALSVSSVSSEHMHSATVYLLLAQQALSTASAMMLMVAAQDSGAEALLRDIGHFPDGYTLQDIEKELRESLAELAHLRRVIPE